MIKIYIFNKSNDISRVYNFKKFFQCIDSEISLTHCTEISAVYQNMLNRMITQGICTAEASVTHTLNFLELLTHSLTGHAGQSTRLTGWQWSTNLCKQQIFYYINEIISSTQLGMRDKKAVKVCSRIRCIRGRFNSTIYRLANSPMSTSGNGSNSRNTISRPHIRRIASGVGTYCTHVCSLTTFTHAWLFFNQSVFPRSLLDPWENLRGLPEMDY